MILLSRGGPVPTHGSSRNNTGTPRQTRTHNSQPHLNGTPVRTGKGQTKASRVEKDQTRQLPAVNHVGRDHDRKTEAG